jgi:hypothetical protein
MARSARYPLRVPTDTAGHTPHNTLRSAVEQRLRPVGAALAPRCGLSKEIKAVISDVKAGDLDRNDAAVMIQGYRALKDFIALERGIRVEDELAAELEELRRERGHAS